MTLPQEFEEDEVREGFYINGMMKKIWAAQLDILDFLNDYCKKHNIRWFMAYGTLLGAVRHQGYIPWDDDCDIWMLRDDFNRLINLLNNEKDCPISIRGTRLADYTGEFPILTNSILQFDFSKDFLQRNHDEPYATTIDIFVLDYVARNPDDEEWRDTAVRYAINIRILLNKLETGEELNSHKEKEASNNVHPEKSISISKTITLQELEQKKESNSVYQEILEDLNKLLILTNHNFSKTEPLLPQINLVYTGLISYFTEDEADLMKCYPSHLYSEFQGYDKHLFDETVELPFEGRKFPAPGKFKQILRIRYGDYLKKVIGDAAHKYPFFGEFEEDIIHINLLKHNPYHFQLKDSKTGMPDPEKKMRSPKVVVRQLLSILIKLQNMIDTQITEMDASTIEEVSRNLQNVSIHIGNLIEQSRGADHMCIPDIQAYCEQVYQCLVLLSRGELSAEDLEGQNRLLNAMIDRIQTDFLDRKEVLFLLDRNKNWKAIESVWRVFSADDSCDVYVMKMPYYYKNADTSLKMEKHIDPEGLSSQVHLISEEAYPITLRHPDLIITVNGYDYYNYIRSVSPEFYTQVLWKYTDQLIYIPWFMIDAFKKSDPQWATVPFFAQIPGVVYADRTIVQSEAVRDLYIDAAEDMDETIPRSYWEEKIQSWGSPLSDSKDRLSVANNIYKHLLRDTNVHCK